MATNDIEEKFGTLTKVTVASPASVGNGQFSLSSDVTVWTNSNNAPLGVFILKFDPSAAPVKNDIIGLFGRRLNVVNTTDDEPVVDSNYEHLRLGQFIVDVDAAIHVVATVAALHNLRNSQEWEFYVKNNLSSSITIDAATWQLWVGGKTVGPAA